MLRLPRRLPSWMNTAVNPAVSSKATGTSAISSRLRALLIASARVLARSWQGSLAALESLDQRDRAAARAKLVAGHRAPPVLRHRAGLDRARVALLVEVD